MKPTVTKGLAIACAAWAAGAVTTVSARDAAVIDHMHEHLDAVQKIQSAVIAGSLEDTREPARWLVEHEAPPGLPGSWEEHVEAMRATARDSLEAQDLAAAASATSRLGLACGACHVANDVTVEFDDARRPSDKDSAKPHMQRHQWAADRMWEGLIGPSRRSWSRGANLLFESPIHMEDIGADAADEAVVTMSRRIHQLAANATTVSEAAAKAEIYAEFLANCAACHVALDKGPGR